MQAPSAGGNEGFVQALLLLLVGIAAGGGLNVFVARATAWFRRRQVHRALLSDVRFCCSKARGIAGYLRESVVKPWSAGECSISYPTHIGIQFWESCLRDTDQLPAKQLPRLLSFYQFAERINTELRVMQSEQQLLLNIALQGELTSEDNKPWLDRISKSVVEKAERTAGLCDQIAAHSSLAHLRDLPEDVFQTPSK